MQILAIAPVIAAKKSISGDPELNPGPSDFCKLLQSDALPTELSPVLQVVCGVSLLR